MSEAIIKAIGVTAVLTRAELTADAILVMAMDLAGYPEPAVLAALERCRKELDRPLTLKAVMDRLHEADGRPSADEAWALAIDAVDDGATVVWSEEIREAFAVARPVLSAGDKIGARMAFRDAYDRLVQDARRGGRPVRWSASLGWNSEAREHALLGARAAGRLSADQVAALLPAPSGTGFIGLLLGTTKPGEFIALSSQSTGKSEATEIVRRCQELRQSLSRSAAEKRNAAAEESRRVQAEFEARKRAAASSVAARMGKDG